MLYQRASALAASLIVAAATAAAATPFLLKDIHSTGPSFISRFVRMNDRAFFDACESPNDCELWRSDGTSAGTVRVADINPGPGTSRPSWLTPVGGTLFFVADEPSSGRELWKSGGTTVARVKDLVPGVDGSYPTDLTAVEGRLFFRADTPGGGFALWTSDGTAGGTVPLLALPSTDPEPGSLTALDGTLFFTRCEPSEGCGLWRSDGTVEGTRMVAHVLPPYDPGHGAEMKYTNANGTLYLAACARLRECTLWKSDGTTAGTVPVIDFDPSDDPDDDDWDRPELASIGDAVFFVHCDATAGCELWRTDGTAQSTIRLADSNPGPERSVPHELTALGDLLVFLVKFPTDALWRSDGTPEGTVEVTPRIAFGLQNIDGTLFFPSFAEGTGWELWTSDGTAAGTYRVTDISPGARDSIPTPIGKAGNTLVTYAWDLDHAGEPWAIPLCDDGTVCDVGECDSAGDPMQCDDQNPCTDEYCSTHGGCERTRIGLCTTTTASTSTSSTTSTSRATVPPTSTTTTTLSCPFGVPGSCDDADPCTRDVCTSQGCRHDPLRGLEGLRCFVLGAGSRVADCAAKSLPRGLGRRLGRARVLVDAAIEAADPEGAQKLVRRALGKLKRARTLVARARRLDPACALALARILGDAETSAEQWLALSR